jgi:hypothetical protein
LPPYYNIKYSIYFNVVYRYLLRYIQGLCSFFTLYSIDHVVLYEQHALGKPYCYPLQPLGLMILREMLQLVFLQAPLGNPVFGSDVDVGYYWKGVIVMAAIVVFFSISILFILSFSVTRRRTHLFEGIIMWCFLVNLQGIYIGVLSNDFKLFVISNKIGNFMAYCVCRNVIVSLSMILFLELNSLVHKIWKKSLYLLGYILFLVGLEYFAELLEIIHHSEKWKLWWSFAHWTIVILLSFVVHKVVRHIVQKEVAV